MAKIYREQRMVEVKHYNDLEFCGIGRYAVELIIDLDALFETLGRKAARSKGKKAVEAGGAVQLRST